MAGKKVRRKGLDPETVEVVNPRYEGATPGMVAKALMRRVGKPENEGDTDAPEDDSPPAAAQSSI